MTNLHFIFSVITALVFTACAPKEAMQSAAETAQKIDGKTTDTQEPQPYILGHTYTVASKVLGTDRRITVRLPTGYLGYSSKPKLDYPVVYVIDGGPEQDFPHIAGIMQSREINATFEPFILVGVETVNRRYQITPPTSDPKAYKKALGTKPGGSAQFRDFLRQDVMPWVNAKYRTNGQDAVIGESLGGLFIVETFLKEPTLFDDYIAITPSLWWDEMRIAKEAKADIAKMPAGKRRLYLTMSDEGYLMQEGLDIFINAVQENTPDDLLWTYVERKNSENHASIYHVAALDAFRALYLSPARTGGGNYAMFPNGIIPPRTDAAKESLKHECVRKRAIATTFTEKNKDMEHWAGMCVLMKPGAIPTKGNWTKY